MKKVLFIAYTFPPLGGGGVFRSLKFAKYLPEFLFEPIIITCKENAYGLKDNTLLKELNPKQELYRVRSINPLPLLILLKKIKLGLLRKFIEAYFFIPDKLIGWIPFVIRKAVKIINDNKIDVIYTTSPPHSTHIAGMKLKEIFPDIPWVADFRDAWSENPFRESKKDSFRDKIENKLEKAVFTKADALIFNTESSLNLHIKKYGELIYSKSCFIPNGFDKRDFDNTINVKSENKFIILHSGDIYGIRSIKPLISAIETLIDKYPEISQKIKIVFLGGLIIGSEKINIDKSKYSHLFEIVGFKNHIECLTLIKSADLLLLITGKGEDKVMIPSKFYEYLYTGVPILVISEKGELTDILENCQAGEWAELDNIEKISDIIYNYLNENKLNKQFKPIYEKIMKYDRFYLTEQLASVFNRVTHV